MRRISFKSLGTIVAILVSLLILLAVGNSLIRLDQKSREVGLTISANAIERSVMQCYALEGAYPPNLKYLEDNYGLILNRQTYVYLYEVVAGNIHPIIGVQLPGSVNP
jgi:competence protein ComGC